MSLIARIASALLVVYAATALAADKPEDFAVRFTVQPVTGASLQRLSLPMEALAALQTANAADVRLFNGNGQSVPLAQIPLRNVPLAVQPREWPIYPVMATPQQQKNLGKLSLRIETTADRSIVRVIEGAETQSDASAPQQTLRHSHFFAGHGPNFLVLYGPWKTWTPSFQNLKPSNGSVNASRRQT